MNWIVLLISGALEMAWATALAQIDNGRNTRMLIVFLVAMTASMVGLAYALRTLPVGTAYAVWTGTGAVLTAIVGMVVLHEPVTVARILCLLLIVAGIVGLKVID